VGQGSQAHLAGSVSRVVGVERVSGLNGRINLGAFA
jgi:hypothetical protein